MKSYVFSYFMMPLDKYIWHYLKDLDGFVCDSGRILEIYKNLLLLNDLHRMPMINMTVYVY